MTNRFILFLLILFIQSNLQSQVKQEWVQRFGSPANGIYNIAGIEVDNSGNVFASGSMLGGTLTDYVTIKYNSSGVQQWSRIFTGLIEDRAIDMALDNSGNVYVTGLSENQTGTYDIITIKYNTLGDSLWVKRYNGPTATTMDQPVAMYIDNNDNIIVSGYSFGTSPMAYITVKYTPDGDSLWAERYVLGGTNLPQDVFADNNGNVFVYGRGSLVLKYDANGNLLWNKSYSLDAAESNKVLFGDASGNIYFGASKWTATFDDFAVAKINSGGDTLWTRSYNGLGSLVTNHDYLKAIAIDNIGNVFLTGEIYNFPAYYFSTIKYNADGVFQWERNYSHPENGDGGKDIVTDNSGNIYVTGGSNDFTTIKYNTDGDSLWVMTYNGPANLSDLSDAMTIDNSGNIYVAGRSRQAGSPISYEMAVIKYSQTITGISSDIELTKNYVLYQNYPNPFNPSTVLRYEIPSNVKRQTSDVKLIIYDILGKEIATLVNEMQNGGVYSVEWNAADYPSGIYFYELKIQSDAEEFSEVKKMILMK